MSFRQIAAQCAVAGVTITALVGTGVFIGRMTASASVEVSPMERQSVSADVVDSLWNALSVTGSRIGPATARVVLVELADFECPACLQFERAALRPARAIFPQDFAVVFHHWPLTYHRNAAAAARAAICADAQGRFLEMHDVLYGVQDSLGKLAWATLAERASVGDLDSFRACHSATAPHPAIEQGIAAAMQLNARGTPTLLLNGRLLEAPPDSVGLVEMIREALANLKPVGSR